MASSSMNPDGHVEISSSEHKTYSVSSANNETCSLVEYFGSDTSYCGYCKRDPKESVSGRRSHNMMTPILTVEDYQDMIDTNWRRSGTFCYNPINNSTCCPNYPIICKALDFLLTRSQRKCIERLNSYLVNDTVKVKADIPYKPCHENRLTNCLESGKVKSFDEIKLSSKLKARRFVRACERKMKLSNIGLDEAIRVVKERAAKRRQPVMQLEDYLYPKSTQSTADKIILKHKLNIEMHHVQSNRSQELRIAEHSIMIQYQKKIHKESRREWDMTRYCDFLVDSPLITAPLTNYDYLNKNIIDDIKKNCDLSVDVEAKDAHKYLLVKPPPLPSAYGTYHCCYFMDGRLIAVGVLDILPKCITTVYFFYDPHYSFLNLGIYSALVEISMIRQMDKHIADKSQINQLTDYYLGFYVHECKKMHYKTRFKPSYLLCSKNLRYFPTEACLDKLKDRKYADFSNDNESTKTETEFDVRKLLQIRVVPPVELLDHKLTTYLDWLQFSLGPSFVELLVNGWLIPYAKVVGDNLLPRLRLKLDGIHRHLLKRHERLNNRLRLSANGQICKDKASSS